jgi:nitrite reductase/ring-hydroxylating ferredoxin subunit/uncharacterized membrane protein
MANTALARVAAQPELDRVAKPLGEAVVAAYRNAGPVGMAVKNALHGVWLHHPLHPALTSIPLGAWATTVALDAKAASSGDESYARAADFALAFGVSGAVGSAVTGLTDWSETDGRAKRIGFVHGLLNAAATALMATAYMLRRRDERRAGELCTLAGFGIASVSGYLGGDLVFAERVGVTHAVVDAPEGFTPVLASSALGEGSMQRVKMNDTDLLLVRQHGRVCALAHQCAHLGGPLSEGTLKDGTVVCPWHGSEFRLDDGGVVNGPSTHPQPCFTVRERNGQIEVEPAR